MTIKRKKYLWLLFASILLAALFIGQVVAAQDRAPTHTIEEARELAIGTTGVVLQGAVSAPVGIFRPDEIWIQDDTAGIDVYCYNVPVSADLQLGDIVEASGKIDEYHGKKEIVFSETSDVALVSRGVPPTPIVTNTVFINENTEGWLVVITGTVSGYTGGTDLNFYVNDGSGAAAIYKDNDTGIDLSSWMTNGDLITLVGIGTQNDYDEPYDSYYQVIPRYQYDIAKGVVLPIALARQKPENEIVTIQGAVTAVPGTYETPATNREMWIQDGTGGIDVYKTGLPIPVGSLSIGDIVTVTGKMTFYRGLVEIEPTAIVTQGLESLIVPKIQVAGNINEDTEGLLVVVNGAISSAVESNGFTLTDASGQVQIYIDPDTGISVVGYDYGDTVQVIGVSAQYDATKPYDSGYQIKPRMQSDLSHVSGDYDPPGIDSTVPEADTTGVNPYFPVKAIFDEEMAVASIDETTFTLEDGIGQIEGLVYYDNGTLSAVLTPDTSLAVSTRYTATVKADVEDKAGNPMGADYSWVFTTTAAVDFEPYHGSIHNHTSYSDGTSSPDAAFTSGQARGLDFMAITDHSYSINDVEWADTQAQALAHTVDGTFVAFRGAEFTQGTEGHLNIYNTTRHPVRNNTTGTCTLCDYTPTLATFYTWLAMHPEATGMFNHPGWMNFNDWEYHSNTEQMMQLLEVGNGAYSYYVWTEEEYRKALDYGWKVGPTNNGDTHTEEWAIDNPGRTGIYATELTYDGVLEALEAMRVFATEDTNLDIYLKGDGHWMGETIPNDGTVSFEIYFNDPDLEIMDSLELYTDLGVVVTFTVPAGSTGVWAFDLDITEGVHYFFVRAEQADGDRTVTAPIWTEGDVDVSPTALEITPAQLTTLSPANFSARITNRGIAAANGITVTFKVDDTEIGEAVVDVPAGGDAFAAVGWMPDVVGDVDITVEITGVPAGDNPDDNIITEEREIVDYAVPLIVIDNGHDNRVFNSGDGEDFEDDLVAHGFNWIEDTDGITTTDLSNAILLVISDPGPRGFDAYTDAEEQVISDYVNNGGALLVAGDSDYSNNGNPEAINSILGKIDGSGIRMNSDGTYDDTNNGGVGPFHVLWHTFPATQTLGIGVNVVIDVGFSGCSIFGVDAGGISQTLTTGNGITLTVVGDDDTYQYDSDGLPPLYEYPDDDIIPMAAVQELPGGGRIAVWGDSQEAFSDSYTYVPGDGFQNEIYNMQTIYWLIDRQFEKWDIAEARADAELNDTPDHLKDLVWVEGVVTAEYGNFYDSLYVQDLTGGITIYAPVTSLTDTLTVGTVVRVVGRVETYQGDTELQIDWDPEQVTIIGHSTEPDPLVLSTVDSALEKNEGWLIKTSGWIVEVINDFQFIIDDGSGQSRVFIDGYNGDLAGAKVGDYAIVIGLVSKDGNGQRIRVRTDSDVLLLTNKVFLPVVLR